MGKDSTYFRIKGIDKVLVNMNKVLKEEKLKSNKALIDCAIMIRRDMTLSSPKIPVDLRNLEMSFFAVVNKQTENASARFTGKDAGVMSGDHSALITESKGYVKAAKQPAMIMGFTANYAAAVHEMITANFARPKRGKARRAGAGAKFFESALNRNYNRFLQIIANEEKLK